MTGILLNPHLMRRRGAIAAHTSDSNNDLTVGVESGTHSKASELSDRKKGKQKVQPTHNERQDSVYLWNTQLGNPIQIDSPAKITSSLISQGLRDLHRRSILREKATLATDSVEAPRAPLTSRPVSYCTPVVEEDLDNRDTTRQTRRAEFDSDWYDEDASDGTSDDENSPIDDDGLSKGFWDENLTPGGPSYMRKPDSRRES